MLIVVALFVLAYVLQVYGSREVGGLSLNDFIAIMHLISYVLRFLLKCKLNMPCIM